MSRTAEERHAARRARIVTDLLPTVEALLAGEQYSDLKVEQIIQRAGMARSTFYRYFQDKGELLLAVSEPAISDILAAASRVWKLPADATRADLERTMRDVMVQYRPHTPLLQAMVETSAYDPAVRQAFQGAWTAATVAQAEHIRRGQRDNWIRAELDADETAGWLVWMAERGMYQLVPDADDAALDRLARSFAAILWHTLYAQKG